MTASGKMISGMIAACMAAARHSLDFVGLAVAFVVMALVARPDLREAGEAQLMNWLQARQMPSGPLDATKAAARAKAAKPEHLPRDQAAVPFWLSKKYRGAPEPLSVLVARAYDAGTQSGIDPTLILAVMGIESGFNPFAQSAVGAQGLMQVMTRVHTDKYQNFGGQLAAFDPVSNLRVGVEILQECIARAGSIEGGLRHYVGSANMVDDGGYAARVMAEHARLRQVASARALPISGWGQSGACSACAPRPPALAPGARHRCRAARDTDSGLAMGLPRVVIQTQDFDLSSEIAALRRDNRGVGAVCSLVGVVRDRNPPSRGGLPVEDAGDAVLSIELEHYPGMTEKSIEAMVDEAVRRFDIVGAPVIHRVGRLQPLEQIVLVAVAIAHRGQGFQACEFLIDYLKTQAPFWKKEHTPQGVRRVDARVSDDAALARWGIMAGNA